MSEKIDPKWQEWHRSVSDTEYGRMNAVTTRQLIEEFTSAKLANETLAESLGLDQHGVEVVQHLIGKYNDAKQRIAYLEKILNKFTDDY